MRPHSSAALLFATVTLALAAGRASTTPRGVVARHALPAAPGRERAHVRVFPLPVRTPLGHDFGDPRGGGRRHEGMDLPAPKMTPVFAVAPGEVRWIHDQRGGRCCDIEIEHDDGWRSRYIHLNNDTPGTDDGRGYGIADGLRVGSHVETGQVIGWVGDSGNAENVGAHLHFELRDPPGRAVDPRGDLAAVEPAEDHHAG